MSDKIIVYKGRTNIITVSLGFDASNDVITSEIRTASGTLIATWAVAFDGDGTDGELVLTLDNSATSGIQYTSGFMDLKRLIGAEPVSVFDEPVEVEFRAVVTQ
jgi:hypothetical protein